ncbi:MAG: hypothetical protein RL660_257 [Bacteroidota bacterium]|jgi:hypothetical protein
MAKEIIIEVIQNMDNGAKLLFRRAQNDEHKYIKLYDTIIALDEYNEPLIKKQLAKHIKPSQFAYVKHTLLQKLIEAKAEHLALEDSELSLLKDVMHIRALRQSAHYDLADKLLNKAYKQAEHLELRPIMQMLTNESLKLNLFNRQFKSFEEIDKIIENARPTIVGTSQISTIQNLYLSAVSIRHKHWIDIYAIGYADTIAQIEKLLVELEQYNHLNYTFSYYYLSTKAIIQFLQNDKEASLSTSTQVLQLFEDGHISAESNSEYFIDALNLYVDLALSLYQHEDANLKIQRAKKYNLKAQAVKKALDVIDFRCTLRQAHRFGRYEEVELLLKTHQKDFENWIRHVSSELQFKLVMSIVISAFVLNKYNDALYYAQITLHDLDKSVPIEHLIIIHVFIVFVVFEMNDERSFVKYYRSSSNFFAKLKSDATYEVMMIRTLHKVFYTASQSKKTQQLQQLHDTIVAHKDDRRLQLILNTFNYTKWLDSKLRGVKYIDLVRQGVEEQKGQ